MHRRDVREAAAGSDHRERRARPSAKEEQARVVFRGLLPPLGLVVDSVEHRLAVCHIVDHPIQPADDRVDVDVRVVRQERADAAERHLLVVGAIIPRQDQRREPVERRVAQQVPQRAPGLEVGASNRNSQRSGSAVGGVPRSGLSWVMSTPSESIAASPVQIAFTVRRRQNGERASRASTLLPPHVDLRDGERIDPPPPPDLVQQDGRSPDEADRDLLDLRVLVLDSFRS